MSSSAVVAIYQAQARPADERPRARRGPVRRQLRVARVPQHAPINEKAAQTVAPAALASGTTGLGP